ncbi:hypothetical protein LP037_087 [Listeria phage LP-037]|uniref:Uncharacterized protein n=2 Tax=Homburgvirus LP37 TaxID=1921127 RepID=A0A6C0R041_9CAUD|nr:hypothetical protein LP037_087 [Listeria phage LP-037]AGI11702.1 hypothetical protein LP037_087 [Listeria phage LP-037]QHZ59448.1 hypothetical protein FK483_0105 [Listeria phage LP-018]
MKRIYKMWIEPFVGIAIFMLPLFASGAEEATTGWEVALAFILSLGYGYFVGRPMLYYFLFDGVTAEAHKREINSLRTYINQCQEAMNASGKTCRDLTDRVVNLYSSNKELLDRLEYQQKEAENLQEELLMLREENAQLIIQVKKHEE